MYTKTLAVHVPIKVNFPTANQITRRRKIKLTALHSRCSWSLFPLLCWGLCCLQTFIFFFLLCPWDYRRLIGVISALSTAAWVCSGVYGWADVHSIRELLMGKRTVLLSVCFETLWKTKFGSRKMRPASQNGLPVFPVAIKTLHSCLLQTCHILQPHKVTVTLH